MILRGGRLARAADAVVDQYHLIAQIGAGGMAEVYVATREGRGGFRKLTCLKILRGELATEPDMVAMFMAEARIAARIEHPHVVQTFEVGESADGEHFIAMEYLEGQAYSRIRPPGTTRQAFPVALHLKVIAEALGGLHYAHEMRDFQGTPLNLVHRDMSPNNVMVTYDGVVKVLDFGIAKAAGASATRTGILKGTVGYMAPEQARGEELDRRTDLYAVGVMLWEALAGQRVWQGQNEVTILTKLLNEPIASPRTVDPSVPEELERICMKALAREREARYATAAELQADLERYLETSGARVTAREIGKAVSAAFDADRRETRAAIDDWLHHTAEGGEPAISSRVRTREAPRLDAADPRTRTLTAEVQVPSVPPPEESARPSRSRLLGAIATAAVGAVLVAATVGRRAPNDAAPPPTAALPAPPAPRPSAPAVTSTALPPLSVPALLPSAAPASAPIDAGAALPPPRRAPAAPHAPAPPLVAPPAAPSAATTAPVAPPPALDAGHDEPHKRRLDTDDPFQ